MNEMIFIGCRFSVNGVMRSIVFRIRGLTRKFSRNAVLIEKRMFTIRKWILWICGRIQWKRRQRFWSKKLQNKLPKCYLLCLSPPNIFFSKLLLGEEYIRRIVSFCTQKILNLEHSDMSFNQHFDSSGFDLVFFYLYFFVFLIYISDCLCP